MKKISLVVFINVCALSAFAQKENKIIQEKNVTRIIKTLSADDMLGRPAANPQVMEKSTAFIESEFKAIGLKPLSGQSSFRQEFVKDRIGDAKLEVEVNGVPVSPSSVLLVSERAQ